MERAPVAGDGSRALRRRGAGGRRPEPDGRLQLGGRAAGLRQPLAADRPAAGRLALRRGGDVRCGGCGRRERAAPHRHGLRRRHRAGGRRGTGRDLPGRRGQRTAVPGRLRAPTPPAEGGGQRGGAGAPAQVRAGPLRPAIHCRQPGAPARRGHHRARAGPTRGGAGRGAAAEPGRCAAARPGPAPHHRPHRDRCGGAAPRWLRRPRPAGGDGTRCAAGAPRRVTRGVPARPRTHRPGSGRDSRLGADDRRRRPRTPRQLLSRPAAVGAAGRGAAGFDRGLPLDLPPACRGARARLVQRALGGRGHRTPRRHGAARGERHRRVPALPPRPVGHRCLGRARRQQLPGAGPLRGGDAGAAPARVSRGRRRWPRAPGVGRRGRGRWRGAHRRCRRGDAPCRRGGRDGGPRGGRVPRPRLAGPPGAAGGADPAGGRDRPPGHRRDDRGWGGDDAVLAGRGRRGARHLVPG